jgi:3-oxoacyl-[acyl-carrier-protein] synthase-1
MNGCLLSAPALVCCAGNSRRAFYRSALRGDQSGIQPLILAGNRRFLTGRIDDAEMLNTKGNAERWPEFAQSGARLFRITLAALEQIRGEIEAAKAEYGADRIAVCAGSCDNGSEMSLPAHAAFFSDGAFPAAYDIRFQGASRLAEFIAGSFGVQGPCFTSATACASSASAIIKGAELVASGMCDAAISGGADLVSRTVLLGFAALEAVSDEICNPFSKNRKGITLGEGAAFFLLRRKDSASASGPRIELTGYGESADAHHMTAPRPDGAGAASAMRQALALAGIKAADVDYINLHGTGTPLNDSMEAAALYSVFGGAMPPASSTKPISGHTLGAAGALELALCWMSLAEQSGFPVHCWDGETDETFPALNLAGAGAAARSEICMSNSFAFGGCNTSLIIARRDNE